MCPLPHCHMGVGLPLHLKIETAKIGGIKPACDTSKPKTELGIHVPSLLPLPTLPLEKALFLNIYL